MEAVMIMLGAETNWDNILTVVSRDHFAEDLKNYDVDKMTEDVYNKVKSVLRQPRTSGGAGAGSDVCNNLAVWTTWVMDSYEMKERVSNIEASLIEK